MLGTGHVFNLFNTKYYCSLQILTIVVRQFVHVLANFYLSFLSAAFLILEKHLWLLTGASGDFDGELLHEHVKYMKKKNKNGEWSN